MSFNRRLMWVYLMLCVLASSASSAQTTKSGTVNANVGAIVGRVVDVLDKDVGVPEILVYLIRNGEIVDNDATDILGNYRFDDVGLGEVMLEFKHITRGAAILGSPVNFTVALANSENKVDLVLAYMWGEDERSQTDFGVRLARFSLSRATVTADSGVYMEEWNRMTALNAPPAVRAAMTQELGVGNVDLETVLPQAMAYWHVDPMEVFKFHEWVTLVFEEGGPLPSQADVTGREGILLDIVEVYLNDPMLSASAREEVIWKVESSWIADFPSQTLANY